jgi:hypothetical protein
MLTDEKTVQVARPNLPKNMGSEPGDFIPIWNGILHEFRNHLTLLLAATTEVRMVTPSAVVPEISQALMDTEWNVQRMNALVAFIDAALRGGAPATANLDEVIERALRLAAPALGRVAVSFNKPRRIDVRNRGTALECLIAGLIVELARVGAKTPGPGTRQQIDVHADVGRGAIVLEIDSSGLRPSPGSWRVALAHDLAIRIGASVTTPAASAGFVVRLDSSS